MDIFSDFSGNLIDQVSLPIYENVQLKTVFIVSLQIHPMTNYFPIRCSVTKKTKNKKS